MLQKDILDLKIALEVSYKYHPQRHPLSVRKKKNFIRKVFYNNFLLQEFFGSKLTVKNMYFFYKKKDTINFRKRKNLYFNISYCAFLNPNYGALQNLSKFLLFYAYVSNFLETKNTPTELLILENKANSSKNGLSFLNFHNFASFVLNYKLTTLSSILRIKLLGADSSGVLSSALSHTKMYF